MRNPFNPSHRLLASLAIACAATLACGTGRAQSLLPAPKQYTPGKGTFAIDKPYRIVNQVGSAAENAYFSRWSQAASPQKEVRRVVRFLPDFSTQAGSCDESYRLRVASDTLDVYAHSRKGFVRAAQTLAQLAADDRRVPCCKIADAPTFRWRGAMLDVSRHFFPLAFVKKQVDILASYKVNRLHLHLTDAAGWRMEIKRYPRLTDFAAWRADSLWKTWWNEGGRRYVPQGTPGAYGGFYTQAELRELVAYAHERGIEIVPEIEMPAHSEEVLTAYPELSCTHEPYKQADFCPGSIATYDFLEHVLEEVMEVFPSPYIHVGGDEAAKASWGKCPLCQRKMQETGTDQVDKLQEYLMRRIGAFLSRHGRRLLAWDEVAHTDSLGNEAAVMVWRGTEAQHEAIAKGYGVVLSPGTWCYLDSYQDAPPTQPEAIGGYLPLEKVYSFRPGEGLSDKERSSLLGVQGNLWTEYVPSCEQAEYMLYPRMLAIAEIGWNGAARRPYADFKKTAQKELDRLQARGVHTFDLRHEAGERGERDTQLRHKGLNARVTYHAPYSPAYPAGGDSALTDGRCGGWANNDGRWQGFIGKRGFDVTIDLGREENVSQVRTDFMQVPGAEIYYPSDYRISLSTDGKNFKEVCYLQGQPATSVQPDVRSMKWAGKRHKARYVRVQASPSAKGGWLFTDEVRVN